MPRSESAVAYKAPNLGSRNECLEEGNLKSSLLLFLFTITTINRIIIPVNNTTITVIMVI